METCGGELLSDAKTKKAKHVRRCRFSTPREGGDPKTRRSDVVE